MINTVREYRPDNTMCVWQSSDEIVVDDVVKKAK